MGLCDSLVKAGVKKKVLHKPKQPVVLPDDTRKAAEKHAEHKQAEPTIKSLVPKHGGPLPDDSGLVIDVYYINQREREWLRENGHILSGPRSDMWPKRWSHRDMTREGVGAYANNDKTQGIADNEFIFFSNAFPVDYQTGINGQVHWTQDLFASVPVSYETRPLHRNKYGKMVPYGRSDDTWEIRIMLHEFYGHGLMAWSHRYQHPLMNADLREAAGKYTTMEEMRTMTYKLIEAMPKVRIHYGVDPLTRRAFTVPEDWTYSG